MSIPLRQWIKGAQDLGRNGSNDQKLSQAYIAASLKIAVSLSDQVCSVCELAEFGISDGLPPCDADWAEKVTVQLQASENYHPDPFSDGRVSDDSCNYNGIEASPEDHLLAMMESIGAADELGFEDSYARPSNCHNQNNELPLQSLPQSTSLLNIMSAKLSTDDNTDIVSVVDGKSTRDKLLHIHALGLVLYEVFSGGEKHPQGLSSAARNGTNQINFTEGLGFDSEYHHSMGEMDGDDQCEYGPSQKKKSSGIESTPSTFSTDHLKAKGLPRSVCELISNMIDCISGDMRGNEAYDKISDVIRDLQLMIEKPHTYLQELDIDKTTLTGLELKQAVFMRDAEYASLQCAYRRAVSGSSELAIISGPSGTGKSWLANRLGRFVTANKGMFLTGKFDQLHQSKPFSALSSAFNDYCGQLMREEESSRARDVAFKLQLALGQDSFHLVKLIPNLTSILAYAGGCNEMSYQDCANGQKRLIFLLCQFIKVITSCLDVPLTLFLDDAQWADEASISVLNQILKTSNINRQFFFVVSNRDDENNGRSIEKIVENIQDFGVTATHVKLDCMDMKTVNEMVSNMLCLSPRLVTSLSEIVYHKTKGNPLFFSQLMLSLNREGLLRVSLSRRRWVWEEEKIQSRSLPDDVASFFVGTISRLPMEVQSALWVLSCFGASADNDILGTLESSLNLKLLDPLDAAVSEGLVNKVKYSRSGAALFDTTYHFCHDRVQEAAYGMMKKEDRCLYHSSYGLALVEPSLANGNVGMLFTAVNQINLGSPAAVVDDLLCSEIAKYNVIAGKKAMEMSDFSSAFSFFDNGLSFLRKNHWRDHYSLSLELNELAAKCSLVLGDLISLTIISDRVIKYARCFDDKLETLFISMTSLGYASKIAELVEKGLSILSDLGEPLPRTISRDDAVKDINQTLLLLDGLADEDLFNYRKMTDQKKLMTMRFLAKLENACQEVNPALQPIVTLKMVKLTIAHGMSPVSPIGFALFGGLVANLGNIRGGHRFTKLAKTLLGSTGSTEIAGEVIWLTTEVQCFVEPMQTANEYRIQGQTTAMLAGDVHWAMFNRLSYCIGLLWAGLKLSSVNDAFTKVTRFMREQGHLTTLYYMLSVHRSIQTLIGIEPELDSHQLTTQVLENKNRQQITVFYFQSMFASFMMGDYDAMKQYAKKYFEFTISSWWFIMSNHIAHTFYGGLVCFLIFRESGDPIWEERARKFQSKIKTWSEQGSTWNFQQKNALMDAERAYSEGNFEDAQVLYTKAIELATTHKYINDEALACELAANFYSSTGSTATALQYYTWAHAKYCEWGANAKANSLYQSIQQRFLGRSNGSNQMPIVTPTITSPLSVTAPTSDSPLYMESRVSSCPPHIGTHGRRKRS